MGWKAMGAKETGGKATGAQDNQETGEKSDMLMGEKRRTEYDGRDPTQELL